MLTYTYLTQGVTGGFRVADQPSGTEYDSWWNYMGVPLEQRRGNKDESTFDWVEELFDYERELGVSAQTMFGIKKTQFNSVDFGTIVIASYAAAHA